eukprot:CAMPEP_0119519748 /NCGR_PEP_ID=MMETSP1344-20130328/35953_1 /TAXON_ID=236787 /ORGANISM="Florenciella parvula, Strain CCMP2471" /LENGTH=309 /DNA_ID=CAMNT_0007557561 /DNA_START=230 /DNA_END=1155 /DNA_ORIENTATION=-
MATMSVQTAAAPQALPDIASPEASLRVPRVPKQNALDHFAHIRSCIGGKRPVVFLDYDGTLSPIVKEPDRAFMKDGMRDVLQKLSSTYTTAIVTGRSTEKIYQFVKLDDVYYAGSHGFEISGPVSQPISCQVADEFRPLLAETKAVLEKAVASIEGAMVEDNKYALSIHYRNVRADQVEHVRAVVSAHLESQPTLCLKHGKKVFELRPKVDWNKGSAVLWILQALGLNQCKEDIFPLYLGDDVTDEDAFVALRREHPQNGAAILVRESGDEERKAETSAEYVLRNPDEVLIFLERLTQVQEERVGAGAG